MYQLVSRAVPLSLPPIHIFCNRQSLRRLASLRGRGEAAARLAARLSIIGENSVPNRQHSIKHVRQLTPRAVTTPAANYARIFITIPATNDAWVITIRAASTAAPPRVLLLFPTRLAATRSSIVLGRRGGGGAKRGGGGFERAVNDRSRPSDSSHKSDGVGVIIPVGGGGGGGYCRYGERPGGEG